MSEKENLLIKGVSQLIDEGAIQMLRRLTAEGDLIFAAVGQLQFEVMQYRLKDEYGVDTDLYSSSLSMQRLDSGRYQNICQIYQFHDRPR